MQMYQMYVKELSLILSEGVTGPEPGSDSAQQLEVLVKDLVSLLVILASCLYIRCCPILLYSDEPQ